MPNLADLPSNAPVPPDGLAVLPQARVFHSVAQSLTNLADTALTFDSEHWDLGPGSEQHSTGAPTRLTCRTAGLYDLLGMVRFASNTTGTRQLKFRVTLAAGGTLLVASVIDEASGSGSHDMVLPGQWRLAVNDYVELLALQNSGGSLDVLRVANISAEFAFAWRSP